MTGCAMNRSILEENEKKHLIRRQRKHLPKTTKISQKGSVKLPFSLRLLFDMSESVW